MMVIYAFFFPQIQMEVAIRTFGLKDIKKRGENSS
jgi:hypothetical protein